jgi:hypothetical protein
MIVLVRFGMSLLELFCLFRGYPLSDLPPERLNQQSAAHADATMNAPHSVDFYQSFFGVEEIFRPKTRPAP